MKYKHVSVLPVCILFMVSGQTTLLPPGEVPLGHMLSRTTPVRPVDWLFHTFSHCFTQTVMTHRNIKYLFYDVVVYCKCRHCL